MDAKGAIFLDSAVDVRKVNGSLSVLIKLYLLSWSYFCHQQMICIEVISVFFFDYRTEWQVSCMPVVN